MENGLVKIVKSSAGFNVRIRPREFEPAYVFQFGKEKYSIQHGRKVEEFRSSNLSAGRVYDIVRKYVEGKLKTKLSYLEIKDKLAEEFEKYLDRKS